MNMSPKKQTVSVHYKQNNEHLTGSVIIMIFMFTVYIQSSCVKFCSSFLTNTGQWASVLANHKSVWEIQT